MTDKTQQEIIEICRLMVSSPSRTDFARGVEHFAEIILDIIKEESL